MKTKLYYEEGKKEDLKGGWLVLLVCVFIVAIIVATIFFGSRAKGQSWAESNRGLYPQSAQVTFNAPNLSIGLIYGYLFQKSVAGLPIGLYGEFTSTLPKSWRLTTNQYYYQFNNYVWERQYSIGATLTLPTAMHCAHFIVMTGIVYHDHPGRWVDSGLRPGNYVAGYNSTSLIGCDLGVQLQQKHARVHLKTDIVNWFRYTEFGFGYCWSYHKSM